jgi:GNAT superfamily N-acetyltransferase
VDSVVTVPASRAEDLVTVLSDAFFDYPVMRYVVGEHPDYPRRLRTIVGLFVAVRVAREDLLLGVTDDGGRIIAAALVNLPGDPAAAPWFEARRQAAWAELGSDAEARYQAYGNATRRFEHAPPHHHLGMIGAVSAEQGQGLGRLMLDHVHAIAAADPGSSGVSLTTEVARNVTLYQHFGYRVVGHARVGPELETWGMFRDRRG